MEWSYCLFCVFARLIGRVVCVEQKRLFLFRNQVKRNPLVLHNKINHCALQISKTLYNTTDKSKYA